MGESDFSAVLLVSPSRDGLEAVQIASGPYGARTLWFASCEEALDFAQWATERCAAFVDTRLPGWVDSAWRLRSMGVDAFPCMSSIPPDLLISALELALGGNTTLLDGPVAGREWVFTKSLLESLPAAVCIRDLNGRTALFNPSYEQTMRDAFGSGPGSVDRTTDLMDAPRKAHWEQMLREAALGFAHQENLIWVLRDGQTRQYQLFLEPVRRGGRLFGTVEVLRDVTDRERQAHILEMYQDIGRIGSWEYDTDSGKTLWSPMMFRLFGLEPTSKPPSLSRLRPMFREEDAERLRVLHRTAIQEGIPFEDEFLVRTPAGERWLRVRCEPVPGGDIGTRILRGVVQDITDLKQGALSLQASEARIRELADRYAAIVQSNRDGYLLVSPDERILESNHAYQALTGYGPDELTGFKLGDLIDQEVGADIRSFDDSISGRPTARYETRLRRKDGSYLDTEITELRFDGSGTRVFYFRDILERKARERYDRTTSELLKLLTSASDAPDCLAAAAEILRHGASCDAVAVRLEQDEDYPVVASSGMTSEFLNHRSCIQALDRKGRPIRDPRGGYKLNCFCGAAIKGKRIPGLRGYGPSGTLWVDDADRRIRSKTLVRGIGAREFHCLGEGFRSFAVVPLRQGSRVFGVLQFLFRKTVALSSADIAVFEFWAARIVCSLTEWEAKKALARSEERFRRSLEAAPVPVLIHTEDGRIMAFNEAWIVQSGVPLDLEGTSIAKWLQDFGTPDFEAYRRSVYDAEEIRTIRFEIRPPTGGTRLWDLNSQQIGRLQDGSRAAVTVAVDITDRLAAEEREQEQQFQLFETEKMASLGTLVAGVAHEINNPNHVIMLNAQILAEAWDSLVPVLDEALEGQTNALVGGMEYWELRSSMPRIIGGIRNASDNIKSIVQELREFSAPALGDLDEDVNLSMVAFSAANLLGGVIRQATDRFRLDTKADLPPVRAGFVRLEQVVINLIMNACQSLDSRNKAVVVSTGVRDDGCTVFLEVQDEGCGMDAAVLAHVKDPFFTKKRGNGGLGLGVSLSNSIVEAYGGRLLFASSPGMGTRATIELPGAGKIIPKAESGHRA